MRCWGLVGSLAVRCREETSYDLIYWASKADGEPSNEKCQAGIVRLAWHRKAAKMVKLG